MSRKSQRQAKLAKQRAGQVSFDFPDWVKETVATKKKAATCEIPKDSKAVVVIPQKTVIKPTDEEIAALVNAGAEVDVEKANKDTKSANTWVDDVRLFRGIVPRKHLKAVIDSFKAGVGGGPGPGVRTYPLLRTKGLFFYVEIFMTSEDCRFFTEHQDILVDFREDMKTMI